MPKIIKVVNHGNTRYRVIIPNAGKQIRKFFKSKSEAEEWLSGYARSIKQRTELFYAKLSPWRVEDLRKTLEIVPTDKSIYEIVSSVVGRIAKQKVLADCIESFIADKESAGRSIKHINSLKYRRHAFHERFKE